jgi:hypothetical protein
MYGAGGESHISEDDDVEDFLQTKKRVKREPVEEEEMRFQYCVGDGQDGEDGELV